VALSDLFSRRRKEHADPEAGASDAPVYPTKVLARFIAGLSTRSQPVLLDLVPVVGANVSFFGEQLGCKIIVEDVSKDIDPRAGRVDRRVTGVSGAAFSQESGSIDGILCWICSTISTRPQRHSPNNSRAYSGRMACCLPSSVRRATSRCAARHTRHVVVNQTNLQHRPYAAARPKQRPLPNREIQRLFEPLHVVEQFLLKTNLREVLFRKASEQSAGAPAPPHA
jgi:hypothetical protein